MWSYPVGDSFLELNTNFFETMIMNGRFSFYYLAIAVCYVASCSTSEEPQPIDCANSDLEVTFTVTNPTSCNTADGVITASATGGSEPYQFALDSQPFTSNFVFTGLGPGTYQLKVKDKNACERMKDVTINPVGSTLEASVLTANSGCKTTSGKITVTAAGGQPPYTYQLNTGAIGTSNVYSNLAAGDYTIKVFDQVGCSTTQSTSVLSGVEFSSQIKGIIDTNCAVSGCHVTGGAAPFTLTTVESVRSRASQIKAATQSGSMPKNNPKLPQAQLDLIACWVDDGAPNN